MLLKLRLATIDDAKQVFLWRNNPWIVSLSSTQKQVTWEEHSAWFHNVVTSEQHLLLIIQTQLNVDAGIVRLDRTNKEQAGINIYLLQEFTGRRIGVQAIKKTCDYGFEKWPITNMNAYIRQDNYPSISAFAKAGFVCVNPSLNCPSKHCEMTREKTVYSAQ
ncbi:MAG: GNAT family N-acetyltransferase [Richelia sp.]|nr:GNAT family N-acetyltransferase [Richelia sp.]